MIYETSLYKELNRYWEEKIVSFHMPGHKMGRLIPDYLKEDLLRYDLTELPGLDNLHFPEGIILDSQKRTSNCVGAKESFFLVNGSTAGILASLHATMRRGDKIIAGRDSHRAFANALNLCGAVPVYIKPYFVDEYGIYGTLKTSHIERAIEENPDSKALFLTRPTYFGVCCDIKKIRELTSERGMLLIVDEAHGAHLPYSNNLPESAIYYGADIVIQSAHKTLPAPNQTGYLHVNSDKIDIENLKITLSMFQTTSPSYILLMLLDFAGEFMDKKGRKLLEDLIIINNGFRNTFKDDTKIKVLDDYCLMEGNIDPTRLVINVSKTGMTGFEFGRILHNDYKIAVEMSDIQNIVCITTVSDDVNHVKYLENCILDISRTCEESINSSNSKSIVIEELKVPDMKISPKDAFERVCEKVLLKKADGRIAKHTITPYPPGIPAICPGELFNGEVIENLINLYNHGAKIDGIDGNLMVDVVCGEEDTYE
jgi:arginine decarboxylase